MSRDVRELILARLLVICQNLDGIKAAYRNKDEIGEDKRPAILIFDAAETTTVGDQYVPKRGYGPNLVAMAPQITILLGAGAENVGPALNAFRLKLLKEILVDGALLGLVGTNGQIVYGGCDTDLMRGRSVEGDMQIMITFIYSLLPQDL